MHIHHPRKFIRNKVYSTSVHDKDDKVFDFVQNVNNHRDTVLPWSRKLSFDISLRPFY